MRTSLSLAGEELLRKQILLKETGEGLSLEDEPCAEGDYYFTQTVWIDVSMPWASNFNLPRKLSNVLSAEQVTDYKRQVNAAWNRASKEDWSDEGAQAVSEDTLEKARAIIDWFLPDIEKPTITATPHGEIDFDWCLDDGRMLTISVGPEGDVAFAWLHGESRHTGKEPWGRQLVKTTHCYLQRLLD